MRAAVAIWLFAIVLATQPHAGAPQAPVRTAPLPADYTGASFLTSHECLACHNGLITPAGEDVSIGLSWRASMMAHSSRDPYWQASVRRETIDHPAAAREIEDECATCHMPMSTTRARAEGELGQIFEHLPIGAERSEANRLAADGVSCTICHQIASDRFGTPESFTGGFVLSAPTSAGEGRIFGPFEIDAGRSRLMHSATGMTPAEAPHIRESELCATCHTLFTRAVGPRGDVIGRLPEQVPYLEWRHSAFRNERSCQSCHMPAVAAPTRMSSVLGEERVGLGRHTFLGGNFFMLRMLNAYRSELGVEAGPQELDAGADATVAQLQRDTATVSIGRIDATAVRLEVDIVVRNLTGHKLPTGYPSRRAWLYVTVRDRDGQLVFNSGEITPSGLILGNDADADAGQVEPHYTEIRSKDQVQIYESAMQDVNGGITTGLLQATAFAKDNRLLPRGFNKATAEPDIAVIGSALEDPDFTGDGDRVRYVVETAGRAGPFRIDVELRYQPIAYRWAQNLKRYDAAETRRFVTWFDAMSSGSSVVVAKGTASAP